MFHLGLSVIVSKENGGLDCEKIGPNHFSITLWYVSFYFVARSAERNIEAK